jgi:hypothetical protein
MIKEASTRCAGLGMLVALTLTGGCSDTGSSSPSSPSSTPSLTILANVGGTWRGTIRYTASGQQVLEPFTMTLFQSSGSDVVTGTYVAERFVGNVQGTTKSSSFAGVFEFNSTAQDEGQRCLGTFDVSGQVDGNVVSWKSPRIVSAAQCVNTPVDMTIDVARLNP